jgi:hypothetical protein
MTRSEPDTDGRAFNLAVAEPWFRDGLRRTIEVST